MTSLRRRLGLEHNPLRRPVDRVETLVVAGLLAVLVLVGPLVALAAGESARRDAAPAAARERATRVRTTATVTQSADTAPGARSSAAGLVRVPVRWTDSDGTPRTGLVTVGPDTAAGATVNIWTDGHGRVTPAPRSQEQVNLMAARVGAGGLLALAAVLLTVAGVTHHVLDRRRDAMWTDEWRLVAPRWSGSA